ncbi:MAG TPA: hypothetical protein VFK05_01755 [Polyangiaceae bacterium]|nr:hypothetical protein [Polyangiaceae bacterium]
MRCLLEQLIFAAACVAISCGGRAQDETGERAATAGGSAGVAASRCDELQSAADQALQALLAANNACEVDADCTSAVGFGTCYTYCVVPLRRSNVEAFSRAGRELCGAYSERGCAIEFACPNTPGANCNAGRCTFEY